MILDENIGLVDVNDKDQGVVDQTYASAIRDMKKADKKRKQFTAMHDAPIHDEDPDTPKMNKGAKRMHLEEDIFEDIDDDSDFVDDVRKDFAEFITMLKYNGAAYRGAQKPAPRRGQINEINIPDNMRLKWFDVTDMSSGEDLNVQLTYVTQEPFDRVDSVAFKEEVVNAFEQLAEMTGFPFPFTIMFDVRSRDGREYGEFVQDVFINESLNEAKYSGPSASSAGKMEFDIHDDGSFTLLDDGKILLKSKTDANHLKQVLKDMGFKEEKEELVKEELIKEESFNSDIDFVKSFLSKLVTGTRIRALRDDEKLPRGFMFKSGTGRDGEVTYKGKDYAYALVDDELRVMPSSEAGSNWSETIYKNESFKVVDKDGKKVSQGGGFTSKEEAEMFAAQHGEKDLKVVKESFEDDETVPDSVEPVSDSVEAVPDSVKPGPDSGLAAVINGLIVDEWETIQSYNDAIVSAELEGYHDIAKVFKDVVNEEMNHVGMLETALSTLSPNTQTIEDGEAEAAEILQQ